MNAIHFFVITFIICSFTIDVTRASCSANSCVSCIEQTQCKSIATNGECRWDNNECTPIMTFEPTQDPTPQPTLKPTEFITPQIPAKSDSSDSDSDDTMAHHSADHSDNIHTIDENNNDNEDEIKKENEGTIQGNEGMDDHDGYTDGDVLNQESNTKANAMTLGIIGLVCLIVIGLPIGVCCCYGRKPKPHVFDASIDSTVSDHEEDETEFAMMIHSADGAEFETI
eukprot:71564_1